MCWKSSNFYRKAIRRHSWACNGDSLLKIGFAGGVAEVVGVKGGLMSLVYITLIANLAGVVAKPSNKDDP